MKVLLLPVIALLSGLAGPAQAQAPSPARDPAHRFGLGIVGTTRAFVHQPAPMSGVSASYAYTFVDRLAIAATAEVSLWYPSKSIDSLYAGRRLDLGLCPRATILRNRRTSETKVAAELYLLAMAGVTWPWVTVPERRAISEKVDGERGWYVGAGAGGAFVWTHWGVFVEVAYQLHRAGLTTTVTALDGSQPPVASQTHPVEHQVTGTTGVLLVL